MFLSLRFQASQLEMADKQSEATTIHVIFRGIERNGNHLKAFAAVKSSVQAIRSMNQIFDQKVNPGESDFPLIGLEGSRFTRYGASRTIAIPRSNNVPAMRRTPN
jgi:hypothetical protein